MSFLGTALQRSFRRLEKIPQFRDQCRATAERERNENNDNPKLNGEHRFLDEVIPSCQVVFDVGANVGDWARQVLQRNPQSSLHCFEPNPPTFKVRSKLAEGNSNITLNHFGLSSEEATRDLHIYDDLSGMNSLYAREGLEDGFKIQKPGQVNQVQLSTLDGYCHKKGIIQIDLLKIDTEGHDFEVLQGAKFMLTGGIKRIQFEYGGANIDARVLLLDFFEFLVPLGFDLHLMMPNHLQPLQRYDQRLENFQYKNFVAIRS